LTRLSLLLQILPTTVRLATSLESADPEITGITEDSRRVRPGSLFVAIPGVDRDGHAFIGDAIRRGAVAVVGQQAQQLLVPYVQVTESRAALAHLCSAWHGLPSRKLCVIGVTGTDGKTTTVNLISSILREAGHRVGMISTVGASIGDEEMDIGLHTTTPDAPAVQEYLAKMVAAGSEYAVVEATSHGLDQDRVTACDFDVAVVTNITREHLDYHKTFEEYRAAKARLFEHLHSGYQKPGIPKVSVLNADDASYDILEPLASDRCYSYGIQRPSDVSAVGARFSPNGTSFVAVTPDYQFEVTTALVGMFSVYNILAAVTAAVSQRVPVEAMQRGIAAMTGVIGRMERIDLGQDFTVIIDFAHTPNALDKALQTVRSMSKGRILLVFGCAGLRDRGKRPLMGEIAGRLADLVFLTAEDPRTEDVHQIIREIAVGCEQAGRREGTDYWEIADRGQAIAEAIGRARTGDVVIVTGKGHEKSMCFGSTEYPWSDHEAVRQALRQRLGASA
jgi:UDP-N-acetylmuramoyl-L-alanyl-D-glutamate--2,6-diaminopimelate ligase